MNSILARSLAVLPLVVLAGAALWLFEDGAGPVSSLVGAVMAQDAEPFTDTEPANPSAATGMPVASAPPSDASPAVFAEGNRCNPRPKPTPYMNGTPLDPESMSLLLQYRNREDLWLACQVGKSQCSSRKHGKPSGGEVVQAGVGSSNSST
jgi:hypothetical protein